VQVVEGLPQRAGAGHFFERAEECFSFRAVERDVSDGTGPEARFEPVGKVACRAVLSAALADGPEDWPYVLRTDEIDVGSERDRQGRHLSAFRVPSGEFLPLCFGVGGMSALPRVPFLPGHDLAARHGCYSVRLQPRAHEIADGLARLMESQPLRASRDSGLRPAYACHAAFLWVTGTLRSRTPFPASSHAERRRRVSDYTASPYSSWRFHHW
jgi:hypothetical protein